MGCDRDRALLEFYVSSGARASELLGVGSEDIDWAGQLVYVVSKGTRERQPVPASPDAFRYLGRYLATDGLPAPGQPVWRGVVHLLAPAIEEGRDMSSMSGILADSSYRLLPA
jgi:integrase